MVKKVVYANGAFDNSNSKNGHISEEQILKGQHPIEISDSEREEMSEKVKNLKARIVKEDDSCKEEVNSTLKKTGHNTEQLIEQLYNFSLKKQRTND